MLFDSDAAVTALIRAQPGLRPITPGAPQLTPNVAPQRGVARHLREKLAVLSCFSSQALLQQPGFDARPALDALAAQAVREHPSHLQSVDGRLAAPDLGWAIDADDSVHESHSSWPEIGACLRALPSAWRRAALLSLAFAEDFVILEGHDTSLAWLAVALPSMWAPETSIGRSFAEVHGRAADSQGPDDAATHLAALVSAEPRWERFVWTVTGHPRLHAHPQRMDPAPWPEGIDGDALAEQAWFRSERQTLIPLPDLGQTVLTIAVDVQPLSRVAAEPGRAARLHAAIASMGTDLVEFRGLAPARDRLLAWLDTRASA